MVKYKTKQTYVVVPLGQTGKTRKGVNIAKLRRDVSRAWRGAGAVEEIRAQRGRSSLA